MVSGFDSILKTCAGSGRTIPEVLSLNSDPWIIMDVVSDATGVSKGDMKRKCNKHDLVRARYVYMATAAVLCKQWSYNQIAAEVNSDHSMLIYARKNLAQWYKQDYRGARGIVSKVAWSLGIDPELVVSYTPGTDSNKD